MKNSFGNHIRITLFGESHGPAIGAVLDGLAPGMIVDPEIIRRQMDLRRPTASSGTARREADEVEILSGVWQGKTTGTPLCLVIRNTDADSAPYQAMRDLPRPGHADYSYECKYHGFQDARGGGHGSGRLTAALTAAGAIVLPALESKGIRIGSHVLSVGDIRDRSFSGPSDFDLLKTAVPAVLDAEAGRKMIEKVKLASEEGNSVGGVVETVIDGLPAGTGEPWFDSWESLLSHAVFSIPAVKSLSFGDPDWFSPTWGDACNDAFRITDGKIRTESNHSGGLNGGVTNGMPVLFRTAFRPTPSIGLPQRTVDLKTGKETTLKVTGRHDACVALRGAAVVSAVAALTVADVLTGRFGTDYLGPDV